MSDKGTAAAKKPFAVFDIDGTVIRWQLYHAVVNQLAKQGIISPDDNERIHQARMVWKRRTSDNAFADYEMTLIQTYQKALATISPAEHTKAIDAVFAEYKDQVYTYPRNLIQELRTKNYLLFAISGSHQEIVDRLAQHLGFDAAVGQVHEIKAGHFTGQHTTPMFAKDHELKKLVEQYQADYAGSVAVGDSAGDIAMLELVDQPIAFNPEQRLYDHARQAGWPIVVERKNVVYKLEQGNAGRFFLE